MRNPQPCLDGMVDRIVPATTGADRACVSVALGMDDARPVVAEPFLQRVVEDRFPAGHGKQVSHDPHRVPRQECSIAQRRLRWRGD